MKYVRIFAGASGSIVGMVVKDEKAGAEGLAALM